VWRVLKLATQAAIWQTTADPPLVGLPVLLALAAILAAVRIALQLTVAGSWHVFTPYGLNAVIAWIALELAVAALFVRPAARATALSAMFVLSVFGEAATTAIKFGAVLLAAEAQNAPWIGKALVMGLYVLAVAWWVGAMTCIVGSVEHRSGLRLVARIAGLWLALFAANAAIPHVPVFLPPDYAARNANWWEVARTLYQAQSRTTPRAEIAQIEKAQSSLLQQELARLAPSRKGKTDIYTLAIAGWGEPDVFVKELDGGLKAIASVLPVKGRILRLVNRRDTTGTVPLASFQNFAAAVHAIGNLMDKDNDVFILFMTSHGEQTGFALQLPDGNAELTPQQVAGTLDSEGIKNRVVIVSACYSGIFLPPLANDNTIVMTAADAQHTSFGCAPERDWTYFGDAFFRQSVHPGSDFADAFGHARVLIHGWELMDNAPPSNPQGSFGPAVVEKLAPFFATNAGQ
jgi:Peptidase C13 family